MPEETSEDLILGLVISVGGYILFNIVSILLYKICPAK